MTEKLTKNILVKLIKEEINKSQLLNEQITKAEIDRRISNAQAQIRFYQLDLRQMRKRGLGVAGGDKLTFRADRAKGLDYPARIDTLGLASRFANDKIKKLKQEISDLKRLPEYTGAAAAGSEPGFFGQAAQDVQKQFNLAMLRAKGDIDPDTRKRIKSPKKKRRGRGPYFFRKYRKAGIDKAFADEFGRGDGLKAAFDRFYDRVNMPARGRDYQFGPGHFRRFQKFVAASTPAAEPAADVQVSQSAITAAINEFARRSAIAAMGPGGNTNAQMFAVQRGVDAINKLFKGTLSAAEKKDFARQIQRASARERVRLEKQAAE